MLFERLEWDLYWLEVCKSVSLRGDCVSQKCGAVLVGKENLLLSAGYNGTRERKSFGCSDGVCEKGRVGVYEGIDIMRERFVPYFLAPDKRVVGCDVVHAEVNCLLNYAGRARMSECVMYVTDEPCIDCSEFLKVKGISRVVWPGSGLV